jgi:hypothetical protein
MYDRQANLLLEYGGRWFKESKNNSQYEVVSFFLAENEFITGLRGKRGLLPNSDYCVLFEIEFLIERDPQGSQQVIKQTWPDYRQQAMTFAQTKRNFPRFVS